MEKQDVLKQITDTAYNVGIGAKKHFATYDIVEKAPGGISFLILAVGVFALFIPALTAKVLSATFIVLGIVSLYITFYNETKLKYSEKGDQLTLLYNKLKALYYRVKSPGESNFESEMGILADIESQFISISHCKQILFSDWYAHYKFFWQHQIDWVNEQKKFKFFRDKVPLSLSLTITMLVLLIVGIAVNNSTVAVKLWECMAK